MLLEGGMDQVALRLSPSPRAGASYDEFRLLLTADNYEVIVFPDGRAILSNIIGRKTLGKI